MLLAFVMTGAIFMFLLTVTVGSALGPFICFKLIKKYSTSNLRPALKIPLLSFSIAGAALGIVVFPFALVATITVFGLLLDIHG